MAAAGGEHCEGGWVGGRGWRATGRECGRGGQHLNCRSLSPFFSSPVRNRHRLCLQRGVHIFLQSLSLTNKYPPLLRLQYEIDTDSIGNVVCKKAEELQAAVTVLARHRWVFDALVGNGWIGAGAGGGYRAGTAQVRLVVPGMFGWLLLGWAGGQWPGQEHVQLRHGDLRSGRVGGPVPSPVHRFQQHCSPHPPTALAAAARAGCRSGSWVL